MYMAFSITLFAPEIFKIDPDNGNVTVVKTLDYEAVKWYVL